MEKPIVSVKNVSKTYSIFQRKSDQLLELLSLSKNKKKFSALSNITFDVFKGETIGIIGVNGSGKSTLSSILAQVTPPTSGTIDILGETSLVAISAGLNNFLTGLENIELKCLMHGLTKKQIEKITPDIIDFADIGDFINQPIKSYSSGMKSRLGFAISVHIQPDILVVDEALSVGDSTFYQKCLEKFVEFKAQGKTIFFISHSLSQVQSISDRILWLNFGQIKMFDEKDIVSNEYNYFINWFNELDKKDKKEYREKMLNTQFGKGARTSQKRIGNKKWGRINTLFQFSLLLIYFVIATYLMFFNTPLTLIGDGDLDNEIVVEDEIVNQDKDDVEPIDSVSINQDGLILIRNATIYYDSEFSNEIAELPFAKKVNVIEELDYTTYKIESTYGLAYINKDLVHLPGEEDIQVDVTTATFLPIFPETFRDTYGFFFSFINVEGSLIKESLQGLTDEYEDEFGNSVLQYANESVSFILNEEDISFGIEINNLNIDNLNLVTENTSLRSEDEGLYYYLTDTYKIYLDSVNGYIRFEVL